MKVKELNSCLRNFALQNDMCENYKKLWKKDWSRLEMVNHFYRTFDFYLSKRFVQKEFIKENFDKKFLRENGILVDDTYSLLNPKQAVLIGNSKSNIRVNGMAVSTINLTDESEADVTVKWNSFVLIHMYDKAKLEITQFDNANATVIIHSDDCKFISTGNVKIKREIE